MEIRVPFWTQPMFPLQAVDPDQEPLIFGVVGEEAMRYFAVERDTGVVWLRQPLDREVRRHRHTHTLPHSHTQPPTRNTPVGTSVYQVNATDPDQGTGGSVLFSFQPPSSFFSIDGARGTVTVTRALDYETTSAYQLTVNATDQDKKRPLSSLSNLAITITDVQDMDPIFTNLPYSTNIGEDVPPGYEVRKIRAIDQDLGRPRGIGYTIISGNTNSIFALAYISGSLTVNGQLDRENPLYSSGFTLTVKVCLSVSVFVLRPKLSIYSYNTNSTFYLVVNPHSYIQYIHSEYSIIFQVCISTPQPEPCCDREQLVFLENNLER
uniref:Cadherin-related 23 n=1 Tax=Hucho hucho TaxID=62062 RepID=A0A4W5PIJ7_9TELE